MYTNNLTREQFCEACGISRADFEALENNIYKKEALEKIAEEMWYSLSMYVIDLEPIGMKRLGRKEKKDENWFNKKIYFD